MIRVSLHKLGKPDTFLTNFTKKVWFEFQSELADTGKDTHNFMKEFIKSHKKRPGGEGKLEKSIDYEFWSRGYTAGFGIGTVSKLKKYWKAINFGSAHIIGQKVPVGGFAPGEAKPNQSSFRSGRWIPGGGEFFFTAKKPIPAINFAENSFHFLRNRLAKSLRILKKLQRT